jgi:hypothetical protein
MEVIYASKDTGRDLKKKIKIGSRFSVRDSPLASQPWHGSEVQTTG